MLGTEKGKCIACWARGNSTDRLMDPMKEETAGPIVYMATTKVSPSTASQWRFLWGDWPERGHAVSRIWSVADALAFQSRGSRTGWVSGALFLIRWWCSQIGSSQKPVLLSVSCTTTDKECWGLPLPPSLWSLEVYMLMDSLYLTTCMLTYLYHLATSPWTHRVVTLNCLPTFSFTSASSCSLCGCASNLFKAWLLKRTRFSARAFPVVPYPLLKIQHVPPQGTQKSSTWETMPSGHLTCVGNSSVCKTFCL